jgi:HlyD family secretion protein
MTKDTKSSFGDDTALRPSIGRAPNDNRRLARRRAVGRWGKRIIVAGLAIAGIYALIQAWLPTPIHVDIGVASRDRLRIFVEEDGRTRVRERFIVRAPLSGTLRRISLDVGDQVSLGDVLATVVSPEPMLIDPRRRGELRAQLEGAVAGRRQADANLGRVSAAHELAVVEARRARELSPGMVSESERDRLVANERVAAKEHEAAIQQRNGSIAEVRAVRVALGLERREAPSEVKVLAPSDGHVLRLVQESEGPITMGSPLLEIGDLSSLEFVVDVLSIDATAIDVGAEIWIDQWGGATLHGTVTRVEPSAFTHISALGVEEQRTNVIARVDALPANLGDGYRVEARILTWEGLGILVVPASAVFRHGAGWGVYVVEGGTAQLQEIRVGHRGKHRVEVKDGLGVGARVVLYPRETLRNGAAVRER